MGREARKLHGQQHCRSEGEQLKRSSNEGFSFLGLEVLLEMSSSSQMEMIDRIHLHGLLTHNR